MSCVRASRPAPPPGAGHPERDTPRPQRHNRPPRHPRPAGERCPGLYLVVSGRVMLSIGAPRGASKVIELIGPGGHIGLAAAVLGAPETVTAQTLADSSLLLIPCEALLDCAAGNPGFALQLVAELSRQVCGLISDIEAFSLHSSRARPFR